MYGKPKIILLLLRLGMGWVFLYSGWTKITDSHWSSKTFLNSADSFSGFFHWLALPQNIVWVDFLNKWGQFVIGVALIFGVFFMGAAIAGIALLIFLYFSTLSFPYTGDGFFIIDQNIIFILVLLLLIRNRAGKLYALGSIFRRSEF